MPNALAGNLADFLLGLASTTAGQDAGNRICVEGLALASAGNGEVDIRIRKLEVSALHLASGPHRIEVGQFALHDVTARLSLADRKPRLVAVESASCELTGVKVQGPLVLSELPQCTWDLAPLATADGTIQAEIVDAKLVFDADVKVPIRQGQVDFNETTVAHVGPDSRMGVSRMGIYVDAPNGRSYLYQFPAAPVAGVEYERRSTLPGPWGTKRGHLWLQPFGEALLGQPPGVHAQAVTDQARQLFDRTKVTGHVQLGDGRFAGPDVQAELVGRATGANVVRLHSRSVGRELDVDVASLSVRDAQATLGGMQLQCDALAGAMVLRLFAEGAQLRIGMDLAQAKLSGLRLRVYP